MSFKLVHCIFLQVRISYYFQEITLHPMSPVLAETDGLQGHPAIFHSLMVEPPAIHVQLIATKEFTGVTQFQMDLQGVRGQPVSCQVVDMVSNVIHLHGQHDNGIDFSLQQSQRQLCN